MKRLHIANIANMAYGYADILRSGGHHSDVLCYDLDHWLSDPSSMLGFKEYPSWFHKVKTLDLLGRSAASDDWLATLQRYSYRFEEVSFEELACYRGYLDALQERYFDQYDLLYGYAYGAIPPLLYAERKYVPVDLGSMRGISERRDDFARLLKYSLKAAPYVILTNPDVLEDTQRLGIKNYFFIPHPVDEGEWKPFDDAEDCRKTLRQKYDADFLILAPARHDWSVKGSDKIIDGVVQFSKQSHSKVKCMLIDWGQEVARSKEYIRQLSADELFDWLPLQSESQLRDLYNSIDALIDQVGEATTFGLTTPKAMASGVPVLTAFDPETHRWCYTEMPPLLAITDGKSITEYLLRLESNSSYHQTVINDQREWVERYHSKKVIENAFLKAESDYLSSSDSCKIYYSLNQKKNEIVYEEKYTDIYDKKYHDAVAYQQMDQLLVDWMSGHISSTVRPVKILDLACGPGSMTQCLMEIPGAEICGVDLSPAFISMARERFPDVEFKVGDAEVIPYPENTFDAVLCSGMLHHIPDLPQVFSEIKRILKRGGYLFVREPNSDNFATRYQEISFAHLVLKHLLYIQDKKPALIEPEEHEFHIDFDFEQLVHTLSSDFEVIDLEFGQRVSYFYDMLFDEKLAAMLPKLEGDLQEMPGLNVLVACRATNKKATISESVESKIRFYKEKSSLPERHLLNLCDFALSILQEKCDYHQTIFELAQSFTDFRLGGAKYGSWVQMDIGEQSLDVRMSKIGLIQRLKRKLSPSSMEWRISDCDGQTLHDAGFLVFTSSYSTYSTLVNAINKFRDYSLIQLAIPVGFRLEGDASAEQKSVLCHCYVIAEALDQEYRYFMVSPKLFTLANFSEAMMAAAEDAEKPLLTDKLSPVMSNPSVDFYNKNLANILV